MDSRSVSRMQHTLSLQHIVLMPLVLRGIDIADLRACRVRELEEKRVNKEMAHIRQKFKGARSLFQ